MTKTQAASAAKAQGLTQFTAVCKKHGETPHYTRSATCVICMKAHGVAKMKRIAADPARKAQRRATQTAAERKRRETPGYSEGRNAYQRKLYASSDNQRGISREGKAARAWREATKATAMPASYPLEREVMRKLYAALRPGFVFDHAVAKVSKITKAEQVSKGLTSRHIASGIHCIANLVETPRQVNNWKTFKFAPDSNRLQRPANRYPNGAYDTRPTAHEFELIANAAYEGTPARVSLKALKETLDAQARAYEAHVDAVESDLCVRYTNAIALMLSGASRDRGYGIALDLSETNGLATLSGA